MGFGEIGRVRAVELRNSRSAIAIRWLPRLKWRCRRRVVAIDRAPNELLEAIAERNGILLVRGDVRRKPVRERAQIAHAAHIVVATGDDTLNLALGHMFDAMTPKPKNGQEIQVSLDSPLVRRAFSPGKDSLIELISVEDSAARLLCRTARLHAIADLLGQPGIYIVLLGFAPIAERVIAHVLHGGSVIGFDRPRVSIFCADPDAARRHLQVAYPVAESLATFHFTRLDPQQRSFANEPSVVAVGQVAPVTAVIVFGRQPKESMPIALAMREAMRHGLGWQAPIFFGVDDEELYQTSAVPVATTPRLTAVLHPFEISAQLLNQTMGAQSDMLAQRIHEYYRQVALQKIAANTPASSATVNDSLREWSRLPHTYRQASRRSADHLPAKLLSAGCYVPRQAIVAEPRFAVVPPGASDELERLARLEHESWMVERRLDGWTFGTVRDNTRRNHPDLIDYTDLPDGTKDFDRNQIHDLSGERLLAIHGKQPSKLVRSDLWIGLTGIDALDHRQATWVNHVLRDVVLPKLLSAHPTHNITLLSPLRPGGDLVLIESALELLDESKRQHRLVVTEGVPRSAALDEFEAAWDHDAVGCLAAPEHGAANWKDARAMLAKAIEACEAPPRCECIVELGTGGDDGRRAQSAFLAQRAHVLIVAIDGDVAATPGSTQEALAWRRDPATIPPLVPRYTARPNRPAAGTPRTVVLDVAQQLVHEDA